MPKLTSLSPAVAGLVVAAGLIGVVTLGSTGAGGFCGSSSGSGTVSSAQANQDLSASIKTASAVSGVVDSQLALSFHYGSNIEDPAQTATATDGQAWGWFQIQLSAHPGVTPAQAGDPAFAVNFMAKSYREALVKVNREEHPDWSTHDGAMAAADEVAFLAERPTVDYTVNRPAAVPVAFNLAVSQLKASGIPTNFTGTAAGSSALEVSDLQGGCQAPKGGGTEVLPPDTSNVDARETALTMVNSAIGIQYAWDGGGVDGPTHGVCAGGAAANDCNIVGYDCSGLVLRALAVALGKQFVSAHFEHSSSQQYNLTKSHTTATSLDDLSNAQPGDLVFFTGDDGSFSAPGHVGIYIGNGRMISAPESGELIQIADIVHSSFWRSEFVGMTDPYAWATAQRATQST